MSDDRDAICPICRGLIVGHSEAEMRAHFIRAAALIAAPAQEPCGVCAYYHQLQEHAKPPPRLRKSAPEICPRCKCDRRADIHKPGYSCDYYLAAPAAQTQQPPEAVG
jgi:hypothetical protein